MLLCEFAIAGISFAPGDAKNLSIGDELECVHEKHNQHDTRALRLSYGGVKFGYVPKPLNWALMTLKEQGVHFKFTVFKDGKNWIGLEAEFPEVLGSPEQALKQFDTEGPEAA